MTIILAIVIMVCILYFFLDENRSSSISKVFDNTPKYKRKPSVMSRSESAFFFELQKQLPTDFYVFPKMRIADVLDIPNGHDYYRMRNKALPKHIDFLICDKYFKPMVAIEVNGSSHNSLRQIEADRIKNEMFKDSGLPLETINVGTSFDQSIRGIMNLLSVRT